MSYCPHNSASAASPIIAHCSAGPHHAKEGTSATAALPHEVASNEWRNSMEHLEATAPWLTEDNSIPSFKQSRSDQQHSFSFTCHLAACNHGQHY